MVTMAPEGQPPLEELDEPADPVPVEPEPLRSRGAGLLDELDPDAAPNRNFEGGFGGGTTVNAFHVPYWGSTETSERWPKATISLLTLSTLVVTWRSSRRTTEVTADSGSSDWLVTS